MMSKTRSIVAGFLSGFMSPGTLFEVARYPSLKGTDQSRIRGDAERVGADFSKVIDREHGKLPSALTGPIGTK